MEFSRYEGALQRILFELRPYLDEIVIIGGWVPYLHKRYGGFGSWRANTSLTAEVDVLVERPLPPGERPTIPEILRAADFHPSEEEGGHAVWEGDVQRVLPEVAAMLVERDRGVTPSSAEADIRGHLADLVEILSDHAG